MELKVKGSTETFHVGRGLGAALLATGVVEEVPDKHKAGVIDPEDAAKLGPTLWTWNDPPSKHAHVDLIRAKCPRSRRRQGLRPLRGSLQSPLTAVSLRDGTTMRGRALS
jgi:hypothetical protein